LVTLGYAVRGLVDSRGVVMVVMVFVVIAIHQGNRHHNTEQQEGRLGRHLATEESMRSTNDINLKLTHEDLTESNLLV